MNKQLWVLLDQDNEFAIDQGMIVCYDDRARAIEIANDWSSIVPEGKRYHVVEFNLRER